MANKVPHSIVNTIAWGFVDGGSSNYSQRKYAKQVLVANMISLGLSKADQGESATNITFSNNEIIKIPPYDNDPIIITMKNKNWDIKWFLIDPVTSGDILF